MNIKIIVRSEFEFENLCDDDMTDDEIKEWVTEAINNNDFWYFDATDTSIKNSVREVIVRRNNE